MQRYLTNFTRCGPSTALAGSWATTATFCDASVKRRQRKIHVVCNAHKIRMHMNQNAESKPLAQGVRVTLIIILVLTLLGLLLRFASPNFNVLNEIPSIIMRLLFLSPIVWLLLRPSKIAYQAVLAIITISFLMNIYAVITEPSAFVFAPFIIQFILAAYLYTSYKNAFNPVSNTSAKRIYAMARDADFKKDYSDARRLYNEVVTTAPGTLEAELSTEALKFLPPAETL